MENIPTAPQNFDHIERYQSQLPVERVKYIRSEAKEIMDDLRWQEALTLDEGNLVKLAGYILELTQENK